MFDNEVNASILHVHARMGKDVAHPCHKQHNDETLWAKLLLPFALTLLTPFGR